MGRWADSRGFYYLAPILHCHHCWGEIELPYSPLPQTDEAGTVLPQGEDPPALPSEEWSATFGCRVCGHMSECGGDEVTVAPVHKQTEGSYQSGKGVYSLRFPCGDRHCTTLVSMFLDTGDGNASEAVALLRSGLFDGVPLPCGHPMKTIPAKFYQAEPVMRRLW